MTKLAQAMTVFLIVAVSATILTSQTLGGVADPAASLVAGY